MASIKHLVDIDLNKNQLTNVKLQHISGNPSGSGEDFEGRIFYDSAANAVKFHNGTAFIAVGTSNASGDVTGVTAGAGMTGTDLTGPVPVLNVIGGTGITANADNIQITNGGVGTTQLADDGVTADKLANSINSAIAANTSKTSNVTHTGEVTGSGSLTISGNVVDEANLKVSNAPTNGYFLSAQSGNTGGLTWAAIPTLNQNTTGNAATATALATGRTIAMTGDVAWTSASFTGSGNVTGTSTIGAGKVVHSMLGADAVDGDNIGDDVINSEHIADGAIDTDHIAAANVTTAKIADAAITMAKLANVATDTIIGRTASGSGVPKAMSATEVRAVLNVANGAQANVAPTTAQVKTALNADFGGNFTIGTQSDDTVSFAGNLAVGGNVTLSGDVILESTTNTAIKDKILLLNQGQDGSPNANNDMGVLWSRGANTTGGKNNVMFVWDEGDLEFQLICTQATGAEAAGVAKVEGTVLGTSGYQALRVGKLIGPVTGNVTGNASGSAGTVTSIGNLTGDITSSNRATTIGAGKVHHAMLAEDYISGQGSLTTPAQTDLFAIHDTSATTVKQISFTNLEDSIFANINSASSHIAIAAGGALTVNTLNQNTTGSAATLTTPRAINGVNFNGSAAITVTAAAGTLSGNTLKSTVLTSSLTSVGTLTGGNATGIVSAASESVAGKVELATTAEALAGSDTDRAVTAAGLAARSFRATVGGATTINVDHGLNTRDVIVQLYDASSYDTVYAQVVRSTTARVILTFNVAPANNDIIVLVTKID
jgi:hypothetical protein